MPDLLWGDVKEFLDPDLMGALPDGWVPDATVDDWQTVLDLVRSRGWPYRYSEGGAAVPLPRAAAVLARGESADVSLRVWPAPGVLAIFRPYEAGAIDFDVDLRELRGQEGVDVLCRLLRAIGRRLGKPVLLAPESDPGHPVLGYDVAAGRVVLLATPRPAATVTAGCSSPEPGSVPESDREPTGP